MKNEAKIIRLSGLSKEDQEIINKHNYIAIGDKLFVSRERAIELIKKAEKINQLETK